MLSECEHCACFPEAVAVKMNCQSCERLFWDCLTVYYRQATLCFECFDHLRGQSCEDVLPDLEEGAEPSPEGDSRLL